MHEIKLDGYRMAARIDNGRVQLLTRTGLDWTAKYPTVIAALANLRVKSAYIDGEIRLAFQIAQDLRMSLRAWAGMQIRLH